MRFRVTGYRAGKALVTEPFHGGAFWIDCRTTPPTRGHCKTLAQAGREVEQRFKGEGLPNWEPVRWRASSNDGEVEIEIERVVARHRFEWTAFASRVTGSRPTEPTWIHAGGWTPSLEAAKEASCAVAENLPPIFNTLELLASEKEDSGNANTKPIGN